MSNTLNIFGNLSGYLTAVNNGQHEAVQRAYLQKYYPRVANGNDNDVAAGFTDSVVLLAKRFRSLDLSMSSIGTLKSYFENAVTNYVNSLIPNPTDKKVTANAAAVRLAMTNSLTTTGLLPSDLDAVNANIGTLGVTDLNDVKEKVMAEYLNKLQEWITTKYTTNYKMGDDPNVKQVLTLLVTGSVPQSEYVLFDKYFNIMKKDVLRPVLISEIDSTNLENYRVNVKTEPINLVGGAKQWGGAASRMPVIIKDLPELKTENRVRYNTDNKIRSPTTPDQDRDVLKQVFVKVYQADQTDAAIQNALNPILPSFNMGLLASGVQPDLERMMKDILTSKSTPSAHISENETEQIDSELTRANWRRVGENTWRTTLVDGTTVEYSPDSPQFENQLAEQVNNCDAIGFGNDVNKCKEFLTSVATSEHVKLGELAASMSEDVTAKVISTLHPKYALAILKAFGFRRKICSDSVAGRQIEKVQRVGDWKMNFLDKKFTDVKILVAMKNNVKLTNFLDLLAQLVNSNPSILNDSYAGETEESTGSVKIPTELAQRNIVAVSSSKTGKPINSWSSVTEKMNKIYGSFSKGLTFNGVDTNSPFGMDNLFPSMVLPTSARVVGSTWGSMVGGSGNKVFLAEHDTTMEYTHNIMNILKKLLNNLTNLGKDLTEDDQKLIFSKVTAFEQLEKELFQTAKNIQTYSQLLKVVETQGNRHEIISESHIKKYVEKYNHLLGRYEKTGSTLNTLISLLTDCSGPNNEGTNCQPTGPL
jgi:hypothetical protein